MFSCERLHIGGRAPRPGTVLTVLSLLEWKGLKVPWRKVLTSACLVDFCVFRKAVYFSCELSLLLVAINNVKLFWFLKHLGILFIYLCVYVYLLMCGHYLKFSCLLGWCKSECVKWHGGHATTSSCLHRTKGEKCSFFFSFTKGSIETSPLVTRAHGGEGWSERCTVR